MARPSMQRDSKCTVAYLRSFLRPWLYWELVVYRYVPMRDMTAKAVRDVCARGGLDTGVFCVLETLRVSARNHCVINIAAGLSSVTKFLLLRYMHT